MSTFNEKKIILIEDSLIDVKVIKQGLESKDKNYKLTVFNDGNSALEYFNKLGLSIMEFPDIIILDLGIPNVDGLELLKKLKENTFTKKIPVVILTLSEYKEDIKLTYLNYANCYVIKPKDLNEFINKIHVITNYWFNIVKLPKQIEAY